LFVRSVHVSALRAAAFTVLVYVLVCLRSFGCSFTFSSGSGFVVVLRCLRCVCVYTRLPRSLVTLFAFWIAFCLRSGCVPFRFPFGSTLLDPLVRWCYVCRGALRLRFADAVTTFLVRCDSLFTFRLLVVTLRVLLCCCSVYLLCCFTLLLLLPVPIRYRWFRCCGLFTFGSVPRSRSFALLPRRSADFVVRCRLLRSTAFRSPRCLHRGLRSTWLPLPCLFVVAVVLPFCVSLISLIDCSALLRARLLRVYGSGLVWFVTPALLRADLVVSPLR